LVPVPRVPVHDGDPTVAFAVQFEAAPVIQAVYVMLSPITAFDGVSAATSVVVYARASEPVLLTATDVVAVTPCPSAEVLRALRTTADAPLAVIPIVAALTPPDAVSDESQSA
jgi:hypothetical protein